MLPIGKSVAPVEAPEQPERRVYEGHFVHLYPLNPGTDGSDLYGVSHGDEEIERLWTYLPYGPFASQEEMTAWVSQIETGLDPLFFTVRHAETQNALGRSPSSVFQRQISAWSWATSGMHPTPSGLGQTPRLPI